MRVKLLGISLGFAVVTLFFTLSVMAQMEDVAQIYETYNKQTVDYASSPSKSMKFVGHVGGTAHALDKQGERLYMGIGPRLHIIDVSNPADPITLGKTDAFLGQINAIQVSGDYAFVVVERSHQSPKLHIYNIAEPLNPVEVAVIENVSEFVLVENLLYTLGRDWNTPDAFLKIFDITLPMQPLENGSYVGQLSSYEASMTIDDNYVYLTFGSTSGGLRIIDVADFNNIEEVAFLPIDAGCYDVKVSGDYVYIANGHSGISRIDVSIPTNPVEVGFGAQMIAYALEATDTRLYAIGYSLGIYNIENSTSPTNVGMYDPDNFGSSNADIVVDGAYVYVSTEAGGVYIMDIADIAQAYRVGSLIDPGYPDIEGDYAHGYQWNEKMDIVHVGSLTIPQVVGYLDTSLDGREVAVIGDFAYVVDDYGSPHVIDIADPAAPAVISMTSAIPSVRDMVISGTYLYLAGNGSHVFDVTDLNDPQPISTLGYGDEMVIRDNLAYIGGSDLEIVDIFDPHNPNRIGNAQLFRSVDDLAISGNYVYIVDDTGLKIVDVTTPTLPAKVGNISMTNLGYIVTSGNYIYVSQGIGIYVFDVTDPLNPVEVNHMYTSAFYRINNMELSGQFIYVSAVEGAFIIDISDPENPVEADSFETPGYGWDLTVRDGLIYVADGEGGLTILSVFEPVSAVIPPAGGTLSSTIDGTSYIFPAGAFTDTVIVTHTYRFPESVLAPPVDLMGIDHFFEVTAVFSNTNQPAELAPGMTYTVTVQYDDTEVGAAIEDTLSLYYQGNEEWQEDFVDSTLNAETNRLITTLDHFSVWGVMEQTYRIFMPIVAR